MPNTSLCVAAIQLACKLGDADGNMRRATGLIEEAAHKGAKLVLLSELTPDGYTLNKQIWDTAEPFDGPTARWLASVCFRLGIYLGTTFLEAEREVSFNAFVLVDPQGQIAGRVRMNPPRAV